MQQNNYFRESLEDNKTMQHSALQKHLVCNTTSTQNNLNLLKLDDHHVLGAVHSHQVTRENSRPTKDQVGHIHCNCTRGMSQERREFDTRVLLHSKNRRL